ncbi:MAG: hypothetical protein IT182_16075 [Acidobacteria bacterium]|nr:hypothetical protein [Acidobacteriota bacterium]
MTALASRVVFPLALLVLSVPCVGAQEMPDLSGEWRYSAGASDVGGGGEPEGPIRGFGLGGRQPMGGGSSMRMAGPAGVDPEVRKQRMELMRELLTPVRRLTIAQDASSVAFTYDDGRTVRYRTNNKAEKHQAINGVVETQTRWKKGVLVRETNLDDGTSIEETFTLVSPRGLVIELEITGGIGRRKPLRRVYEPVE